MLRGSRLVLALLWSARLRVAFALGVLGLLATGLALSRGVVPLPPAVTREQSTGPSPVRQPPAPAAVLPAPAGAPAERRETAPRIERGSAEERGSTGPSLLPPAPAGSDLALPLDRMIIRTAQLVLTVSDVESAVQAVRALVTATPGARILAAQTRYENDQQVATLTLQVPAAAFETVMSALRRLARRVESEATSSQDVTEEYIDLTAHLRTLRATEARLLALLERAQRLEDILVLERELAQVRSQIERLEGRQRYLAQRSDLATITVTLQPEGLAARPQPPRPVWDPLQTAERAFQASLRLLLRLADLVITVLAFSWWLALLALLLAALWRRRRSAGLGASS